MGPELTRIGDKVRRDWLFSFLKDPHREQPDTAMLQYRLSDDQLRDLAAFLLEEYRTTGGEAETAPASYEDPRAVAEGRAAFVRRGCYGCHHLAGRSEETRLNSSHVEISYAVFCLKKKKKMNNILILKKKKKKKMIIKNK